MQVTLRMPSDDFERYAVDAFQSVIGSRVPITFGELRVKATLVEAIVDPDGGRFADLTFEV